MKSFDTKINHLSLKTGLKELSIILLLLFITIKREHALLLLVGMTVLSLPIKKVV